MAKRRPSHPSYSPYSQKLVFAGGIFVFDSYERDIEVDRVAAVCMLYVLTEALSYCTGGGRRWRSARRRVVREG